MDAREVAIFVRSSATKQTMPSNEVVIYSHQVSLPAARAETKLQRCRGSAAHVVPQASLMLDEF